MQIKDLGLSALNKGSNLGSSSGEQEFAVAGAGKRKQRGSTAKGALTPLLAWAGATRIPVSWQGYSCKFEQGEMQSCLIPCCHCSQAVLPHGHPTGCATPPGPAPGASQTSWWNRPSIPLPDLQPQQLLLKTLLLLPANTSTPSHTPVWKQNSQGQAVFSEQISLEQTLGKKHLYFTSIKNDV